MARTFIAAIGQVEVQDATLAAREAITQCRMQLEGSTPGAAILVASVDLDHAAILAAILEAWPAVQLIGCSSDGEFSSRLGCTQDSLLLVALASDTVEFAAGHVEHASGDAAPFEEAVGEARARVGQEPALAIVYADGMTLNGEGALLGLGSALGHGLPIAGGAAADGWRLTGTLRFHGGRVLSDAAVFLLLCGRFRSSIAVKAGWKPIGRIGVVTSADPANLRRAVDAILLNAWEAMDDVSAPQGRVWLKVSESAGGDPALGFWAVPHPGAGSTVCLEIANDGPSPRPEVLPRMFDPFFTTKALGRGLGLASARGLLQAQGAGIQVLPRAEGGLSFRLHFPPAG